MPRSDRSSDPEDGSITSDSEDERAVGPTSPTTTTKQPAPWNLHTGARGQAPENSPLDAPEVTVNSPRSPVSPKSRWQEALEVPEATTPGRPRLTGPNAKFRALVLKVIHLNRLTSLSDEEPGIDPRSNANAAIYGSIREQCSIEIIDYGAVKYKRTTLTNAGLEELLTAEQKGHSERPLWAKVRWINIGGVSWDVVKCLALNYNIHPLAIEDMLHNHQTFSSKADYYPQHLMVRILCHTLADEPVSPADAAIPLDHIPPFHKTPPPTYNSRDPNTYPPPPPGEDLKFQSSLSPHRTNTAPPTLMSNPSQPSPYGSQPATKSFVGMTLTTAQPWVGKKVGGEHLDEESAWAKSLHPTIGLQKGLFSRRYSRRMASLFPAPAKSVPQSPTQVTVNELKKGDRVQVKLRNLFIVLFRDGTLITIHQDPRNAIFDPILNRLTKRDTLLRNSSDASMLLQNVLDIVVNNAVEVVEVYHQHLLRHERDILIRPKMSTVRALHILSGDLAMHHRTLTPVKTLIYGLRRYDLDRCKATANPNDPGYDEKKVAGFLSHKSKIYLADVMDHVEYILASMGMFSTVTENLIAYTFNVVSYEMNTTVQTLTIMTVIFFPLSFLTGYFGQNFRTMPSVQHHSEAMFWEIAGPVMFVVCTTAFWGNIISMVHYLQKRKLQDKIRQIMTSP